MYTPAIANEFDSYLQDRAQRLSYQVRTVPDNAPCALADTDRLALVEFADPALRGPMDADAPPAMRPYRERGHFMAWADHPGALVQVNGTIGARTFAEQFFADAAQRSLPLPALRDYVAWLAAGQPGVPAAPVTLLILMPAARELALVRLPSMAATQAWLRRQAGARVARLPASGLAAAA